MTVFDEKTHLARYTYKKCGFIKVDIDFSLARKYEAGKDVESPDDVITKVSRPYLDYPTMD